MRIMTEEDKGKIYYKLHDIELKVVEIQTEVVNLKENFVTKAEFWPVRVIAYGIASVCMLAVLTAVVGIAVVRQGKV